jgi:O-antigen/teichoic acid export membrane protein
VDTIKSRIYSLLRRSERIFKTDMVYLAQGSFWLNGSQIAAAGVAFLLAIAFANLVPQASYGTYKYIISIYGTLGVLSLSGLGTAVTRAVAKGNEGEFTKALWFNFRWETLIFLSGIIGAVYYYIHGNPSLALGFLIIGIFSPIKDSADLYPSFLSGKKDFKTMSLWGVCKTAIAAAWLFVTILITKNPVWIVLSFFFINTAISSFFSWLIIKTKKTNDKQDDETLTLSKHVSFMNNVSGFADQIDNLLIFHFFGPISLAVYNFAQAIPDYLGGFLKNIGSLAMPKFAQRDKEEVKKTIRYKSFKVFLFGVCMSIGYIICAPIFFHVFFPKYDSSIRYSQIYSTILMMSAVLPTAFLDSQMAIKAKYIINFGSSLIKIVLLTIGVIYFGIWGAIIGRIISKAIGVSMVFFFSERV